MRRTTLLLTTTAILLLTAGCGSSTPSPTPTVFSNVPTTTDSIPTSAPTSAVPSTSDAICSAMPPIGQPAVGLPPVTEDDWVRGAPDAPVTLIEYSDFQ